MVPLPPDAAYLLTHTKRSAYPENGVVDIVPAPTGVWSAIIESHSPDIAALDRPSSMSASRPANLPTESPTTEAAPKRRRPRKLNREPVSRRPESAGGVALPPTSPSPPPPPPPKESPVPLPTTPTPRRQPRKLNRPAATPQSSPPSGPEPTQSQQQSNGGVPVDNELEALKNRVKELEAQVQELYARPVVPKPPRKRGQGRKKQEASELQRLQEELEAARKELEAVKLVGHGTPKGTPKPKADEPASAQGESQQPGAVTEAQEDEESDDDAETILRSSPPALSPHSDREVTLSGSYSVRLPPSLSMKDVRAIQNGVTSAGNIARSLAAEYNAWQATQSADRGSWSQWFGSCSASIARIANEVQGEAFVEWRAREQSEEQTIEAIPPSNTSRTSVGTRSIAADSALRRPAVKARTSTSTTVSSVPEELLK
ncbi:hypothetical protein H2201_006213 [Coniosporium apollinis]|uniref:Uncharacterized protein n=1 Tax=Coniosporium apollinis TaxID=61459 RepID=A0ABQ9NMH3_9PEZI|nr:hypothetical protein H2201_006213 [Coniosporium apollinis]